MAVPVEMDVEAEAEEEEDDDEIDEEQLVRLPQDLAKLLIASEEGNVDLLRQALGRCFFSSVYMCVCVCVFFSYSGPRVLSLFSSFMLLFPMIHL